MRLYFEHTVTTLCGEHTSVMSAPRKTTDKILIFSSGSLPFALLASCWCWLDGELEEGAARMLPLGLSSTARLSSVVTLCRLSALTSALATTACGSTVCKATWLVCRCKSPPVHEHHSHAQVCNPTQYPHAWIRRAHLQRHFSAWTGVQNECQGQLQELLSRLASEAVDVNLPRLRSAVSFPDAASHIPFRALLSAHLLCAVLLFLFFVFLRNYPRTMLQHDGDMPRCGSC